MISNTDNDIELKKEIEVTILVSNYIKNEIKKSASYSDSVTELDKLLKFLKDLNIFLSPSMCKNLLKQNQILNDILKMIVNNYISEIKNGSIYDKINDDGKLLFIENYCLLNNIELGCLNNEIIDYNLFLLTNSNDNKIKEKIIEHNQKLVIYIAKRYIGRGILFQDLIQEGNIGLMKAIERFDATKGCKFSTYAVFWIRQSITRVLREQARTIRVPAYMTEIINKLAHIQKQLALELNREPSEEELAKKMNISVDKIKKIYKILQEPISLETPI